MGIFDRVMGGLDKVETGLDGVNESLQRRIDAAPPRRRRLQEVRGPVGWLHRHDVAARLIFLAAFVGSLVIPGRSDLMMGVTLGLAAMCLLLVVWFAVYAGDWF